jgi:radical SAM-linked protein
MQRIFDRAGIAIRHTEGYNPRPYMTFALPLSLGVESRCELMDFDLLGGADINDLPEILTEKAPTGIMIKSAYQETRKFKEISFLQIEGILVYDDKCSGNYMEKLTTLFSTDSLIAEKKTKSGTMVEDNIMPLIENISFSCRSDSEVVMSALVAAQNPGLSPNLIMNAISKNAPNIYPDFSSFMRMEVYDSDKNIFR